MKQSLDTLITFLVKRLNTWFRSKLQGMCDVHLGVLAASCPRTRLSVEHCSSTGGSYMASRHVTARRRGDTLRKIDRPKNITSAICWSSLLMMWPKSAEPAVSHIGCGSVCRHLPTPRTLPDTPSTACDRHLHTKEQTAHYEKTAEEADASLDTSDDKKNKSQVIMSNL